MIKECVLLSIILLSCSYSKNIQSNKIAAVNTDSTLYKVYKIDSLNNYYLIYAKKQNNLYKIVSKKEVLLGNDKVKVGGKYDLKLSSIWTAKIMVGGVNASPSITPHVTCLSFDDSTRICIERDSINDLHQAENLRGLYLNKNLSLP